MLFWWVAQKEQSQRSTRECWQIPLSVSPSKKGILMCEKFNSIKISFDHFTTICHRESLWNLVYFSSSSDNKGPQMGLSINLKVVVNFVNFHFSGPQTFQDEKVKKEKRVLLNFPFVIFYKFFCKSSHPSTLQNFHPSKNTKYFASSIKNMTFLVGSFHCAAAVDMIVFKLHTFFITQ